MSINCVICNKNNTDLTYSGYNGYVKGTLYNIYNCIDCNTNFIFVQEQDKALYDLIYSNNKIPGYDRYLKYAETIINEKDPLKFLAESESTYYPVYKYLKKKKKLKILEVGCGYGYLTYAVKSSGFDIKGIDISESAINFARNNFGAYFQKEGYKEYAVDSSEKFDLIIATEVIEHLDNPVDFLRFCKELLNDSGEILVTTPNKDYYNKHSVWQTDLPPVHITWLSKKSFLRIGEILGLNVSFTDFSMYYPPKENRGLKYLRSRKEILQKSLILEDGTPIKEACLDKNLFKSAVKKVLIDFSFIRNLSNAIYNFTMEKDITLGILLKKNK